MQAHQIELINSIRGLAEAIPQQCNLMATLTEFNHTDGLGKTITVMVKLGPDDWMSLNASDARPHELTKMRDDLCDFIVQHRSDYQPITTSPGAVIGEEGEWVMSRREIREAA